MEKNTIWAKVRFYREKLNMTQELLAERADMCIKQINNIENGRADPRSTTIQRLAAALGVDVGRLFDDDLVVDLGGSQKISSLEPIFGLLSLQAQMLLLDGFRAMIQSCLKSEQKEPVAQHE